MENDPFWKENGAEVVFSGPSLCGEGEHKVMDFIRHMRSTDPTWSPELRHIFYGLDADLIMLSLVTHEPNFMLLREKMSVRHGPRSKNPMNYGREDFELLEVVVSHALNVAMALLSPAITFCFLLLLLLSCSNLAIVRFRS